MVKNKIEQDIIIDKNQYNVIGDEIQHLPQ